jgi:polynucleotide 5'-kinase involved in rRNA processing
MDYYYDRMKVIRNLEGQRGIQSFVYDGAYLQEEKNKNLGEAVLEYGIAELDAVKAKMRRGNMICIMGPPKGGKTTFTTYLVECALHAGLNVAVWPLEGTPHEWI